MTKAIRCSGAASNESGLMQNKINRIRKILIGMACIEIPPYLTIDISYTSTITKWQLDVNDSPLNSCIKNLNRRTLDFGKKLLSLNPSLTLTLT